LTCCRLHQSGESPKISSQFQLAGAVFAALLGLAFGSFLNVFLTRFPEEESIVSPRSHCRHCEHTLAWWENLPLLSWIILRGRCRQCRAWIGIRYPLIELAVAALWIACWLRFGTSLLTQDPSNQLVTHTLIEFIGHGLLCWLLVALAALDQEYFWLPDILTLPGIVAGFIFTLLTAWPASSIGRKSELAHTAGHSVLAIVAAAGLILAIRLAYWLVRRQEGIGLGDAKLMAMFGSWLGLRGSLESFILATLAASAAAFLWLAVLAVRRKSAGWSHMPLPFGTFLCLAALVEIFCPLWLFNPARLGF
jgi:leader peptidase (prepilin peptidase) / N-methyltransferase